MRRPALLILPGIAGVLLASCGSGHGSAAVPAAEDAAVADALADPIMTDPDLLSQNQAHAAIVVAPPMNSALPPIDRTGRSEQAARIGRREVIFGGRALDTAIVDRDRLPPGHAVHGPALIEEGGSTTVVPPGWSVALDHIGCLVFKRS